MFDDQSTGSRRSSRTRTRVYKPLELSEIAQDQLKVGFAGFNAEVGTGGSSSQDCSARLHYIIGDYVTGLQFNHVEGSTGQGHGHAEMDALHKFWTDICAKDLTTFISYRKKIQCESKPCCVRCSAVLGLLGIEALDEDTRKTRSTMGSTEWAVTPDVRELLAEVTSQPAQSFSSLGSCEL
jgi:cytidine deaminase